MFEENSFGDMLKSFRVRKGTKRGTQWTQQQVADTLEVSRGTYHSWENGKIPSAAYLKKIVALFQLKKEDEEALYRAAAQVPLESPEINNLPFLRNPFFAGREAQLQSLDQLLKESDRTRPISINGLGGIGKTQLALEYAHRQYKKRYRAVLWVNAANKAAIESSCVRLTRHLNLLEQREGKRDHTGAVEAVTRWLEAHTSWLLVLDNVDDLNDVVAFLPSVYEGHVILTTRLSTVGTIAAPIELDTMEPEEAMLFLLRRSRLVEGKAEFDTITSDMRTAVLRPVSLLSAHPLALDQAGAFIEETGISIAQYLRLYEQECHALLDRRGSLGHDHPDAVTTTLKLNLTKACEHRQLAMDIMHFCSFLEASAIPELLLHRIDGLTFDALAFNEAIGDLQRYSLLKRSAHKGLLSMHPLVQEVIVQGMSLDFKEQWFLRVDRTLNRAREEKLTFDFLVHSSTALSRAETLVFDRYSCMVQFLDGRLEERGSDTMKQLEKFLLAIVEEQEMKRGIDHAGSAQDLRPRLKSVYKAVFEELRSKPYTQGTDTPEGCNSPYDNMIFLSLSLWVQHELVRNIFDPGGCTESFKFFCEQMTRASMQFNAEPT